MRACKLPLERVIPDDGNEWFIPTNIGTPPVIASPDETIPKSVILTSRILSISIGLVLVNSVVSNPVEPTFAHKWLIPVRSPKSIDQSIKVSPKVVELITPELCMNNPCVSLSMKDEPS